MIQTSVGTRPLGVFKTPFFPKTGGDEGFLIASMS